MRTGLVATKIAIGAFIIPYMFVLSPQLVLVNVKWYELILIIPCALIGMLSISAAVEGWIMGKLNILERIALLIGGLLLIETGIITDIIGFALFGTVIGLKKLRNSKTANEVSINH